MSSSEPKRLGPWTTDERLGDGGNAVALEAEHHPAEGRLTLKNPSHMEDERSSTLT